MAKPTKNVLVKAWGSAYEGETSVHWTLFPQDLVKLASVLLSPSEILLLLILNTFAGTDPIVFPSLSVLADLVGDGDDHRNVKKILDRLAEAGFIKILPPDKKGGRTKYDLRPAFEKLAGLRDGGDESGDAKSTPKVNVDLKFTDRSALVEKAAALWPGMVELHARLGIGFHLHSEDRRYGFAQEYWSELDWIDVERVIKKIEAERSNQIAERILIN